MVLPILLALIIASAAIPASAYINLLQNPGFESGYVNWWIDGIGEYLAGIGGDGHTGDAYAYVYTGWGEGWVRQGIEPPRCASYLEFWYRGKWMEVYVHYSDTIKGIWSPGYAEYWTLFHVDLETTKQVSLVEIYTYETGWFEVDDFDLEACAVVGGELMMPTPIPSPEMLIAVVAAVSVIALGYRFKRR